MSKIAGYIKTLKQYMQTPKGRHDFIDYTRALFIIIIVMFIVYFLLKYLSGEF